MAPQCPDPICKLFHKIFSEQWCVREDSRSIPVCVGFNIESGCRQPNCSRKHCCSLCTKDHEAYNCPSNRQQ